MSLLGVCISGKSPLRKGQFCIVRIAILIYGIFWFEKFTVKRSVAFVVFVLPLFVYLFSLDFMSEKIEDRVNFKGLDEERLEDFEYHEEKDREEYVGSLDRF